MLSQLSRGYGSWTAGYVDPTYGEKRTHPDRDHALPEIDPDSHIHGVTVGGRSGRSTAVSYLSTKKAKDGNTDSVGLPKTYTTRKGALQLYVASFDDEYDSENDEEYDRYALRPEYQIKHTAGQELIDLSLKLGTMGRLAMSVLNFGDQEYDKEQSSISDAKNKAFLKFLHSIDEQNLQNPYIDNSLRPGGDLNTYLQELRSSSSLRNYSRNSTYIPKNREFLELQALLRDLESNSWPSSYQQDGFSDRQSSGQFTRPVSRVSSRGGTPGLPSTPRSSHRVLSSKQLTASLKSTSYLGRPSSQLNDDDDIQSDIDYSLHSLTSAGLGKQPWTPENSTDELLIDKFFRGSSEDWETDEGNKRRRFKERSFVTGSELLSQGRNSHRGDGKHCDVKCKGEGFAQSTGQVMNRISEEVQVEGKKKKHVAHTDGGRDNGHGTEHVKHIQQTDEALERLSDTGFVNRLETGGVKTQHKHDRDKEFVDVDYRHDDSHSALSGDSGVKHVPTVISLQSFSTHKHSTSVNRNGLLFKRRKSLSAAVAFDPERLKHAIQGPRSRPKSSHAEKTQPLQMKDEMEERHGMLRQHNLLYSSTFTPSTTNWSTMEAEIEPTDSNIANNEHQVDDLSAFFLQRQKSEMNTDMYPDENAENEMSYDCDEVIQEEALLKNIKECNEEVEQIEAKADNSDTDSDSDSGTYVDEHLMQELVEAEEKLNDVSNEVEEKDITNETNHVDVMMNSEEEEKNETANVEEKDQEESKEPSNLETEDKSKDEVDEVTDEHSDILSRSNFILQSKFSTDGESTVNEEGDDLLSDIHKDQAEGSDLSQTSQGDQTDAVHSEPALKVSEEPDELDIYKEERDNESKLFLEVTSNKPVNEEVDVTDDKSDDSKTNKSDIVSKNIQPDSPHLADGHTSKDDRPEADTEADEKNTCHENIKVEISEKTDIEENVSSAHGEFIPHETDQEIKTAVDETIDLKTSNHKVEEQKYNLDECQNETTEDNIPAGDEDIQENVAQVSNRSLAESHMERKSSEPIEIGEKDTPSMSGNKNSPETDTPVEASSIDMIAGEIETRSLGSLDVVGDGDIGTRNAGTSASIADQIDAVGQSKLLPSGKKKGKKTEFAILPPGKRPASPPKEMLIPDHLKEAMDRKTMQSYETLEKDLERRGFLRDGKVTALVDESLSGPTLEAVGEGLTEEELEIAKQILQKKIDAAKQQLDGKDVRGKGQKKKSISKPTKKGKKKKVEETKTEEELQREAIREKQALEKQKRDEEVKELQRKIAERRKLLQAQDDAAGAKAKELREQMEKLEQEAEDLQRAEDEARDILQEVRKKQREERDARRKAELERRKQDALDRREREKKDLEEKKKKEMEMMEKIADAEMRRRLREEEERKMYEEERLAQERYEAELREAQRLEEEEEEKMRELERQAEEEAMQRLIEEREAAERQRRRLLEEEEIMREAERLKREQMLLEEQRLAEERQKIEDEEQRRRAREMERLMELRRAEEEARQKLQEELERRRSDALARRDHNLENKLHVDKLRHYQGITRAWTFSYFVKWPRETYERPIGDGNQRKVKINNPAPKKVEAPAANTEAPAEPVPQ